MRIARYIVAYLLFISGILFWRDVFSGDAPPITSEIILDFFQLGILWVIAIGVWLPKSGSK